MGNTGTLRNYKSEFSDELCFYDFRVLKDSFVNWMVEIQGFPIDGFIITKLDHYITSMKQLEIFHQHYNNVFHRDAEFLTQCSLDIIYYIRDKKPLPLYSEN